MAVHIRAGRFRTPGVVQRVKPDAVPDASNKIDLTDPDNWETFCGRRMELMAVTMRESVYAAQPVAAGTTRITLRKDPQTDQITPKMRVKAEGRTYQIDGVVRLGSPVRLLELQCVEVA